MPKTVIKKNGKQEPFIKEKIVVSVVKTGASLDIARGLAEKIEKHPEEKVRTAWIKKHILDELKLHNPDWPKRWYNYDKNVKRLHNYTY